MMGLDGNMIPATNKTFNVDFCMVSHWKNRKIVEENLFYDLVGMMKQLGLMQIFSSRISQLKSKLELTKSVECEKDL